MASRKRIAVIGGGCSGLAAVKCCLDEGLDVVCFEREEEVGGLWNYSEDVKPGKGSVYKSCVINTCKEMSAFSDYPMPQEYPPFVPHHLMLEYFKSYMDHFKLSPHIRFGTSVENVTPASDYVTSGCYDVTSRKTEDTQSAETTERFDGVMVCSGHHVHPYVPELPGLKSFTGTTMHSHEYRRPEQFRDKNVLIVGIGNSAVDIAVDVSRVAKKVYVSTRRGAWIVSRMGPLGWPADAVANSRFVFTLPRQTLQSLVQWMAQARFDHDNYGLQPKHGALEAHPTINDELPYRIMVGAVEARPDVSTFTPDGVIFEDASTAHVDAVILATGYDYKFKFIDPEVLKIQDNKACLYKYVFPPQMPHPTLAVIGLVQAIGAVMPISEMQARWYARVMAGRATMPSREEMNADIEAKNAHMRKEYIPSRRHTLETFWISYMDELADHIGARPSLLQLALQDPFLALRCYFGPCVAAQYRLMGPGAQPGAAAIIRSVFGNFVTGTKRRHVPRKKASSPMGLGVIRDIVVVVLVVLFAMLLYESILL